MIKKCAAYFETFEPKRVKSRLKDEYVRQRSFVTKLRDSYDTEDYSFDGTDNNFTATKYINIDYFLYADWAIQNDLEKPIRGHINLRCVKTEDVYKISVSIEAEQKDTIDWTYDRIYNFDCKTEELEKKIDEAFEIEDEEIVKALKEDNYTDFDPE